MFDWPVVVDPRLHAELVTRLSVPAARVQVLRGPGGVGKSTLASAVALSIAHTGKTVLPVIALQELSTVPLAAMAPTQVILGSQPVEPVGDRLQQLYSLLASGASRSILFVDDAPWLDDVSASLIYQLVRSTGIRALATARTDHELSGPLARLEDEGRLEVTDIVGLDATSALALIETALGGPVDPDSARRLVAVADGNPLFLRELLVAAVERGAISAGRLGLTLDLSVLPARLHDSIAARFENLDEGHRAVAELIAVAEPMPESMLGESAILTTLVDTQLVRRTIDGQLYLAHPLFTEVLVTGMTKSQLDQRRIEAAGRFDSLADDSLRFKVDALLAETSSPPDAVELAWAARYAYALTDHALAIRLADMSLASVTSFQALHVRAAALSAMQRIDEAEEALDDAMDAAATDLEKALILREWGYFQALRLQRPAMTIPRATEALETMKDPAARAMLEADVGRWRLMVGEGPFVDPRDVAVDVEDPIAVLNSIQYELMYLTQVGELAKARAALQRGRPLADAARLMLPTAHIALDIFECITIGYEGNLDAAAAFAQSRRRDPFSAAAGIWSYASALVDLQSGRIEDALVAATSAVEQLKWRDFTGALAAAIALRSTAAAQLGQVALAREGLAAVPDTDVKAMLQASEAEAWLYAWADDPVAAAQTVREAAVSAIERSAKGLAGPTLYVAVQLGQASAVIDLLRQIESATDSALITAMLGHAEASVAADPDALLRAAERLAVVGVRGGAVDAATEASELYKLAGKREGQRKAALRASQWSNGLTGYRQTRFEHGPFELTEREWAIATAAAERERSKEIADRLGISVRTVDNHLTNIYRKLGVTGRDGLRSELDAMAKE